MNVSKLEFEAGYIVVTTEHGASLRVPISNFLSGSIALTDLVAAILDGTAAKVVADDNVIGGIPLVHRVDLAAGALASTDVVLTHKTRVIDAWVVLTGAGVATTIVTIKNTADAITDGMDVSGSDTDLVRAANIDDAHHEIAAGGKLRVQTETGATQPDCTVYVLGVRVA